jgi:hypothetical protein
LEIRALCCNLKFEAFFSKSFLNISKWTFLKMSKIDFLKKVLEKNASNFSVGLNAKNKKLKIRAFVTTNV